MESARQEELLDMLKAVADDSRLTLLRLLNEHECTVGELAERVKLGEPTVSHHLAKLREAGLVTLRMAGSQRFYRVYEGGLAKFKQQVQAIEVMPPAPVVGVADDSWIDPLGWDEEDLQVLRDHTSNGVLTHLPSKRKRTLVILRWLATLFQPETMYTEPQVNDIIKAVYADDYVGLRRDLIDMGYLHRERGGGKYWLAPVENEQTTP